VSLAWLAVRMTDGAVLDDLTTFEPDWPLRDTLSNYDTATGNYYLDGAPDNWPALIAAGATLVACYDEDDVTRAIQWAGYVNVATPHMSTESVELSLCTLGGYFTRRYVTDITYSGTLGRNQVIADLVSRFIATGGGLPGVPLSVVTVGGAGPLLGSDRIWQNADNQTVADRIGALISEFGGEWSIRWAWAPDRMHILPTLYVGDRIGQLAKSSRPNVTFTSPGAIIDIERPTDYSDGAGANHVTAYSSGQGDLVPYGTPIVANDFVGRPVFEYRYEPVPSETDTKILEQHATQAFGILSPGAQPLSLTLALEELAPVIEGDGTVLASGQQYGLDWHLGDDVGYDVEACKAFPAGLTGVARPLAVEWTDTTVTPTFAQPEVYVENDTEAA
jgi:hypothetical protein